MSDLSDAQLLRYSRHILLDELGVAGQEKLLAAHVLILGVGGLGAPAALYLAAAGVGHLTLVDDDAVDLTNLQRQILYTEAQVGTAKTSAARSALAARNSGIRVDGIARRADAALLDTLVAQADLVLDCGDNYATRHALNAACVHHHRPLVSGAAVRFDGQLAVYDLRAADSPCYACVFPPDAPVQDEACATLGVLAPLVGVIGSLQAAEAVKLLCGAGTALAGRMLLVNLRDGEFETVRLQRQLDCPVCGRGARSGA